MMKTLDQAPLEAKDRRAIEAAAAILRERFPVASVVLFGSKARGDDDEESDIDLLVLTTLPLSWQERNAVTDSLFNLQLEHSVVISTVVVSEEEWDHGVYQVLPIHEAVEEEGVTV